MSKHMCIYCGSNALRCDSCNTLNNGLNAEKALPVDKAIKDDSNKAEFHLLPFDALAEVGEVYKLGATKYAPNNWRKGMKWSRMFNACIRHLSAFWEGESYYKETVKGKEFTCHHLGSAVFCMLSLIWYDLHSGGEDDRNKKD